MNICLIILEYILPVKEELNFSFLDLFIDVGVVLIFKLKWSFKSPFDYWEMSDIFDVIAS